MHFHHIQASFMRNPSLPAYFGGLNGPQTLNDKLCQAVNYSLPPAENPIAVYYYYYY
jgi:hypothetical protein